MLETEIALLLLLRRRNRALLDATKGRPTASVLDAALDAWRNAWARDIASYRTESGLVGTSRLHRELITIGETRVSVPVTPSTVDYDIARGRILAQRAEERVRSAAGSKSLRNGISAARTEQVAATEVAESFSKQRDASLSRLPASLDLWKVWDAVLDKHTCPKCGRAHGTAVRVNDSFPQGRPGSVHAKCRCVETVLPRDWIDFD